jgi:hypothetical protein
MEKFNRSYNSAQTIGNCPDADTQPFGNPKPGSKPTPSTQEEEPSKKKKKNPYEITC